MKAFSKTFSRFAEATSRYAGKPVTFLLATAVVLVWAGSGPMFHYGETWQLVINTGTTIVTFLMVFLIQNSQNREGAAVHIKLDELIRVTQAHNALLNLEELDDETLDKIRQHYRTLAGKPSALGKAKDSTTDDGDMDEVIRAAVAATTKETQPTER
jgi:low affinity Fe/Cu permease